MLTPENGCTTASLLVVCPAIVPVIVGATAPSTSITVVVPLTVGVVNALETSLSVNVVVAWLPGAPAVGVNDKAWSSEVPVAAEPVSVYVPDPPLRPVPVNVPPPPDKVIVSVSLAPALRSPIVTPANGEIAASLAVVCPAAGPVIVGATAPSTSITVVVPLTVGVVNALDTSLSVNVVVAWLPGAPAVGVNDKASTSLVTVAAAPLSV